MFFILVVLSVACTEVLTSNYNSLDQDYYDINNAENIFKEFIDKYAKKYEGNEYQYRLGVFKGSLIKINNWNNESPRTFGVTEFSDLTYEEFSQMYMGFNGNFSSDPIDIPEEDVGRSTIPEYLDWRDYDVVTPVKDQLSCGSCYVFSAIAHIESQYALKHNTNPIILSEQQALDCNTLDLGCKGGSPGHVFNSLASQGGSMRQEEYPYVNQQLNCRTDKRKIVVKVKGTKLQGTMSEETLKRAVAMYGPLSIGIESTEQTQHINVGKVYTPRDCSGSGNHAVVVVGYGRDNDDDYWLIKNSWGTTWGDRGYMRLKRGIGACGIGSYVALADVE